jgi:hypothetical protein
MSTEPLSEAVKAEHRRKLAKTTAEQAQSRTVLPSVKINVPAAGPLVMPDENEIRPLRPIPRKDIDELIRWDRELRRPERMLLERAFDIGFKLTCWRDLIPHGQWLKWLEQNIPEIPDRSVRRYIQLWENREWLLGRFEIGHVANLEVDALPGIRQAVKALEDKRRPKEKRAHLSTVREIQAEVTPESPATVADSKPVELVRLEPDQPVAQCCPTCGRPLL